MDILSPNQRSVLMSRIQSKDTKPEMKVRRAAHALGYRFRLHRRDLPSSPDLVFPGQGKIILVHGCFWHRHSECKYSYFPKSNVDFWEKKFLGNIKRDCQVTQSLQKLGWMGLVIWECETHDLSKLLYILSSFLRKDNFKSNCSKSNPF